MEPSGKSMESISQSMESTWNPSASTLHSMDSIWNNPGRVKYWWWVLDLHWSFLSWRDVATDGQGRGDVEGASHQLPVGS